jgi:hypothetical protein
MSENNYSPRSWQEISAFYDDLVRSQPLFAPMQALVHRLAAVPTASELERNTSMHTLLVSNAPSRAWRENVLRITFHPGPEEFEFTYSHYDADTNISEKRCSIPESWDTLARFVRYKFGILLPDATQNA